MKINTLTVPASLLACFVFVGALFFLTACAAPSVNQTDPRRAVSTPAASMPAGIELTRAEADQTVTLPANRQVQTLPEAGGALPNSQASSSLPVSSTPTSTPVPKPPTPSPTPTLAIMPEVPTQLIIPAIQLDAPVLSVGWSIVVEGGQQVSEWDVPRQRAVGWLNSSALVGARGNAVLVGHQNIDGRVFENLEYLKEGDEIQVQAGQKIRRYIVAVRIILLDKDQPIDVRRENARWIGPSADERLTLVTCWPRNDNTHRLILVALPAP
jgi:sortase A